MFTITAEEAFKRYTVKSTATRNIFYTTKRINKMYIDEQALNDNTKMLVMFDDQNQQIAVVPFDTLVDVEN